MKPNRKQQILEVLAAELETHPGSRITTARLARSLDVSEAALYRHFPSKAKMFESLLEFAEESVFGLITRIIDEQTETDARCYQIGLVVLRFCEKNPGIARVLAGDALVGEHERLRHRAAQFFARLETQFAQLLREGAAVAGTQRDRARIPAFANLICNVLGGHIAQFVRTEFRQSPCTHWEDQWRMLATALPA